MTPPHDLDLERELLGSLLLFPHAVEDVLAVTGPDDCYSLTHAGVFQAIVTLYRRGDNPGDLRAVLAEAESNGVPVDRGEAVTWQGSAMWRSAASKLAELRLRRDLYAVAAAAQEAGDGPDPIGAIEALKGRLSNLNTATVDVPGSLLVAADVADAEHEQAPWVIPGLFRCGWRAMLVGFEGAGKALHTSTPVPTPSGWSTMGALRPGDEVFGVDGAVCRVVAVTDPWWGDCYRVRFDDGSEVVADAGHLWLTETLRAREAEARTRSVVGPRDPSKDQRWKRVDYPEVRTTAEIAATLHARNGHCLNHTVTTCDPVDPPAADLPISPYTFGAWLGDGSSRAAEITCVDVPIVDAIRAEGWEVYKTNNPNGWRIRGGAMRDGFEARCRRLGVWGDKHIPDLYLRASKAQRLALMQGLMDTDGTVDTGGTRRGRGGGVPRCEITLCNKRLAFDTFELLLSLGIKATIAESPAVLNGRVVGTRWRMGFCTNLPLFRLPRKAERMTPLNTRRATLRYITAVEPCPSVPVCCIEVDRPDGMFLVGHSFIPTHNSTLLSQAGWAASQGLHPFTRDPIPPVAVLHVDLENTLDRVGDGYRPLVALCRRHSPDFDRSRMWVWHRPDGIDIRGRRDHGELEAILRQIRPDLVCIGPLRKVYRRRPGENDEASSLDVQRVLDDLRHRYGFALLIEHHAPHADGGFGGRKARPFGSSTWLGWPEFGFGMTEDDKRAGCFALTRWRGDRVAAEWPDALHRGQPGGWPWDGYRATGWNDQERTA